MPRESRRWGARIGRCRQMGTVVVDPVGICSNANSAKPKTYSHSVLKGTE